VRNRIFCLLLLAFAVAVTYANTLHGEFVFDDSRIYNNPALRITSLDWHSLAGAALQSEPATRPVANLTFALNYYLHGDRVEGYHLVNILIHLATAFFLYLLIDVTLRTPALAGQATKAGRAPGGRLAPEWLAFFAALLWLVHPVQSQSVAYVVQRMNSLAAMFYLVSLYCYVRCRLDPGGPARCRFFFAASGVAGVLAMGCKEISITLPLFILLYEWYFLEDLDLGWLRRRALPIGLVVAVLAGLALLMLGGHPVERILAGYQGRPFTPGQRLLTELRVVFFYLSLLVFPHPSRLNLDHDFAVSTSLLQPPTTLAAGVGLLVLLGVAVWSARRERLLSFAILWFLGNLLVESSLLGLELVFEHRLYLPAMLLFAVAVAGVDRLLSSRRAKALLLVGLAVLLGLWTVERNRVWHDRVSLWSDCVAKSPGKARPHNNLGVALKRRGRLREAAEQYRMVIAMDPDFIEAYNNLGNVLLETGQPDQALLYYGKALDAVPDQPVIHNNMGKALLAKHRYDRAMMHFAEALRLKPDFAEARENLGRARWLWRRANEGQPGR